MCRKWQLLGAEHYKEQFRLKGAWPDQTGFEHHCLWQVDKLGSRFWQPLLNIDGENKQFGKTTAYGPDVVNDYVLNFMEQQKSKPFLVYYPMILVHNPFDPTPDSESLKSKNKQRNFEDMVAYMDKLIGKVVDKLEELGERENTLIIYLGDNGSPAEVCSIIHNHTEVCGGKGLTKDRGTHVPLICNWPGTIPASVVEDDLIDTCDYLPTILEAAGVPVPEGYVMDGRSFLPQLRGETGDPRDWIPRRRQHQASPVWLHPRPARWSLKCWPPISQAVRSRTTSRAISGTWRKQRASRTAVSRRWSLIAFPC